MRIALRSSWGQVWPRSSLAEVKFDRGQVWPKSSLTAVKFGRGQVVVDPITSFSEKCVTKETNKPTFCPVHSFEKINKQELYNTYIPHDLCSKVHKAKRIILIKHKRILVGSRHIVQVQNFLNLWNAVEADTYHNLMLHCIHILLKCQSQYFNS